MADLERVAEGTRQQEEEGFQLLWIETERRRKLPQDRPKLPARSSPPRTMNLASGASGSVNRFMWVMTREPLTAKTTSSGVCAAQRAKISGRCRP